MSPRTPVYFEVVPAALFLQVLYDPFQELSLEPQHLCGYRCTFGLYHQHHSKKDVDSTIESLCLELEHFRDFRSTQR